MFDNNKYQKQCGEIFLTTIGKIIFHCTICEHKYEGFQEYAKHLGNEHFMPGALEHILEDHNIFEEDDVLIALNNDDESVSLYYESEHENIFNENETYLIEVKEKHEFSSPLEQKSLDKRKNAIDNPQLIRAENEEDGTTQAIKPKKVVTDRKYKCTVCGFACSNSSNLAGHKRRHSTFKPYLCTECTKAFYTSSELKRHAAAHRGERPFLCHDCGTGFPSKDKLALHFKRHLNIRDKVCTVCEMKFYNANLLRNHMRVHSDERPYKCNFCSANFKRRTGLTSHVKTHQNKREYQCKLCPASFNQNPGLHSHMKCRHPGASIN